MTKYIDQDYEKRREEVAQAAIAFIQMYRKDHAFGASPHLHFGQPEIERLNRAVHALGTPPPEKEEVKYGYYNITQMYEKICKCLSKEGGAVFIDGGRAWGSSQKGCKLHEILNTLYRADTHIVHLYGPVFVGNEESRYHEIYENECAQYVLKSRSIIPSYRQPQQTKLVDKNKKAYDNLCMASLCLYCLNGGQVFGRKSLGHDPVFISRADIKADALDEMAYLDLRFLNQCYPDHYVRNSEGLWVQYGRGMGDAEMLEYCYAQVLKGAHIYLNSSIVYTSQALTGQAIQKAFVVSIESATKNETYKRRERDGLWALTPADPAAAPSEKKEPILIQYRNADIRLQSLRCLKAGGQMIVNHSRCGDIRQLQTPEAHLIEHATYIDLHFPKSVTPELYKRVDERTWAWLNPQCGYSQPSPTVADYAEAEEEWCDEGLTDAQVGVMISKLHQSKEGSCEYRSGYERQACNTNKMFYTRPGADSFKWYDTRGNSKEWRRDPRRKKWYLIHSAVTTEIT